MQVTEPVWNDPQTAAVQMVSPAEAPSSEMFYINVYDLSGLGRLKRCEEMALFLGNARQLDLGLFHSLNTSGTWKGLKQSGWLGSGGEREAGKE